MHPPNDGTARHAEQGMAFGIDDGIFDDAEDDIDVPVWMLRVQLS